MKKLLSSLLLTGVLFGCESGDDEFAGTYSLSGTVTGLTGTLTVSVNGTEELLTDNGSFTLTTRINENESYQVSILDTSDDLTCSITNERGQSTVDVTNIEIGCNGNQGVAYHLNGLAFNTEEPSIVTFAFHLIDRFTNQAIDTLNKDNITDYLNVTENGSAVSPSESFLEIDQFDTFNAEYVTVFAIDVSSSMSSRELTQITDAIKGIVADPQTGESKLQANQSVTLLTFDSTVKQLIEKSQDPAAIANALDTIRVGAPSTNLYGAIQEGVSKWDNEISLQQISYGSLIIFTDGNDTSAVVTKSQALTAAEGKDLYFISIGSDTDTSIFKEFTNPANIFDMADFSQLNTVLSQAIEQVKTYENGLYILSYASPKRAGSHNLTIEAIDDYRCDTAINDFESSQLADSGTIKNCADKQSYQFNADNFTDVMPELTLQGPRIAMLEEITLTTKLRWTHETPSFNWTVTNCRGNFEHQISENNQQITFTRTSDELAVAYLKVFDDLTNTMSESYVYLLNSQSDFERISSIRCFP